MSFTYHDRGLDIILTPESYAAYLVYPSVRDDVAAHARRNVDETGHPCDVFADDETTLLFRARPT
jgi:hypothetical protein